MKPNTLGFIFHVYRELNQCCELFGVDPGFAKEASRRFDKISRALSKEFDCPIEKIHEMPADTELPPVTEEKLLELAEWLARDKNLYWIWLEIADQKREKEIDEIIEQDIPGWQPGS
jgi:hypothetical protein